jgi:nitroreductase
METMECIRSRRSIRQFTEQTISDEVMQELLEAVRWAPSWANSQTWEVVVVKDPETRKKLVDATSVNRGSQAIIEAAAVMVFCSRQGVSGTKEGVYATSKGDWSMFDCALACQNFCLAANSRGLGTLYIGRFNHQQVDAILGLPAGIESVVIIPVGFAAKVPKAPPRKSLAEFVHLDRFGNSYTDQ